MNRHDYSISVTHKANELHQQANQLCFISNSLNFSVSHHPTFKIAQ